MRLDRLNAMEEFVIRNGSASLEDLANEFQISTNTVRRDLGELLGRGQIKKVYGGVSVGGSQLPLPISIRSSKNSSEKHLIGLKAASLVKDGSNIFLDSGSTTVTILPHLASKENITIITHSLTALYEASKHPNLKIIALGGLFNPATSSYVGMSTSETLSQMSIDTVFIAATGVSLEHGLTNTTYFEAEIKRCVTKCGKNLVLMADHSKFNHSALFSFCPFESLSAVVTDCPPPEPYLEFIEQKGIQLLCDKAGSKQS